MLTFNEYNNIIKDFSLNEDKNTHSTHLEDLLITNGKRSPGMIVAGLSVVLKQLDGRTNSNVSTKIDGAPAVVAGWLGNNFFVGSKSLFNKEPKINYTDADIDLNHPDGPNKQLKLALKYLKMIIPKGKIFQGDFLFDNSTLKTETIEGIKYYTYHPNTIKYSVQTDSPLGKKIKTAKIGIVFHTEYTSKGDDPKSIKLKSFDFDVSKIKSTPSVFAIDAFQTDLTKELSFKEDEKKEINNTIEFLKKFNINWNIIEGHSQILLSFTNTYFRLGASKPSSEKMFDDLIKYINEKSIKEQEKVKTEKSKTAIQEKYDGMIIVFETNKKDIIDLFKAQSKVSDTKLIMINKLNQIKSTNNFLVKNNGELVVTGEEGFVITKTSAKGVKLVDRINFSTANFSPDFKKGWSK